MGSTLKWLVNKHYAMAHEFEQVSLLMEKVQSRVHPLNKTLCEIVRASGPIAQKTIFSDEERPGKQIRFLDLNTLMLPIAPENPDYRTGYQYERLADMFTGFFQDYDILCLQEVFSILSGELKEIFIELGQKAGFLYCATQDPSYPIAQAPYWCDSGLLILSRFPIVEHAFQQFSKGYFQDAEVQRGCLYAKVEVTPGKHLQLFTVHTQCTNFSKSPEYVPLTRGVRDTSIKETIAFMEARIDGQSLVLFAGDFNIIRYPTNKHYMAKLFGENPGFAQHFHLLDSEYEDLLQKLQNGGSWKTVNCWDRDNPNAGKCLTFSIIEEGEDGKVRPFESVLTVPNDYLLENCLDYIFEIRPASQKGEGQLRILKTQVEPLHVKLGQKGAWADKDREYSQLSDHYGLSATIELV